MNQIRPSSVFNVLDRLLRQLALPDGCADQLPHLLPPTEDGDGLLVLVRVDLDLVDELLVDELVLVDQHQKAVELTVKLLVLVETHEVLLPQPLLIGYDDIQLGLLASDPALNLSDASRQLLPPGPLIVERGRVSSSLGLVLLGLGLDVGVGDFAFVDLVVEGPQPVFGPLGVLGLELQFGYQLLVVVLGLMEGFIELGVDGLAVPDCPFQILELLDVGVQQGAQAIALLLQPFPLVLQAFDGDAEVLVLLVGPLVFVVNGLDFEVDLLDLVEPGVVHSFLLGVLPDQLLNVEAGLLEVDLQDVDFLSEVQDGVLVDVALDSE